MSHIYILQKKMKASKKKNLYTTTKNKIYIFYHHSHREKSFIYHKVTKGPGGRL